MPVFSRNRPATLSYTLCRQDKCTDMRLLRELGDIKGSPVFILGHHRSGTTMLYELLGRTQSFNILTAYHAVCYDCLLTHNLRDQADAFKHRLNNYLAEHGLQTRLIDNVKINADMPEEYGMILYKRSGSFSVRRGNAALLRELCRKCQHIGDPSLPILLKNPWDYNRFDLIHELIPTAKIVFIHRDPLNVLNSQIRALQRNWTAEANPYIGLLFQSYARAQRNPVIKTFMRWATNPDSKAQIVRHVLTYKYIQMEAFFRRRILALPPESHMSIHYEGLCSDPAAVIDRILNFVGVEAAAACDYSSLINPREVRLLHSIERTREHILRKLASLPHTSVT